MNMYVNENVNKAFQPVAIANSNGNSPCENNEKNQTKSPFSTLTSLHSLQDDTYERIRKKKKRLTNLIAIGGTATAVGVAAIALFMGRSQGLAKKFRQVFGGVESKFANVKNKHLHKALVTGFGVFEKFGKIMTNSTPMKDYTLHKAMEKTAVTRSIRDSISKFFTNENRNSVSKSLQKSKKSYNEFITVVQNAINETETNKGLLKKSPEAEAKYKELKDLVSGKAQGAAEFFTEGHFEKTHKGMMEDMDYLSQEMSFKRLFSQEALQGFVPESILAERRSKYAKELFHKKNQLSFSYQDVALYAKSSLDDVNMLVYSIKNAKTQKTLKECSVNLENSLKHFSKDSINKDNREANAQAVRNCIQKFKDEVSILSDNNSAKQKMMVHMNEYEDLFKEDKPGVIQQIRMLAGDVWGDQSKFDLAIKEKADIHRKDLKVSLNRMINMFDKQRDITIGSGPADVLGLLMPVAAFGYAFHKADSKDKKVGTSLELGIPLVGAYAVYYKALKLQFNGVKALATSTGAALLLNLLGETIYKQYAKNKEKARLKAIQEQQSTPQQL